METEEEFLKNAATTLRFAEEEVKQFLTWTGKRSPYSCAAETIKENLRVAAADLQRLRKEYGKLPASRPYLLTQPAISRNGSPALE